MVVMPIAGVATARGAYYIEMTGAAKAVAAADADLQQFSAPVRLTP